MNDTEKTLLLGAGLIGLAIVGGAWLIGHKVSKAIDKVDLWKGSNIPEVANDVHQVTGAIAGVGQIIQQWTRA